MTIDSTSIRLEFEQVDSIQLTPLCGDGEGRFARILRITYEGGKVLEHILIDEDSDKLEVVETRDLMAEYDWIEEG